MTSFLTDIVLMIALIVTALRSGRMYRELRALRSAESGLGAALAESDRSINRAAEAVVALKHEGVPTLRALEAQVAEAREMVARLETLVARADPTGSERQFAGGTREFSPGADADDVEMGRHRFHARLAR